MNKLPVSHLPGILFIEYNRQFFLVWPRFTIMLEFCEKNKKNIPVRRRECKSIEVLNFKKIMT